MVTIALELSGVCKKYGKHVAVKNADLAIEPGQTLCLLGPNGAGKTTLISMIAGLKRPDAGKIIIFGMDPQVARRQPGAFGLAQQELGIYPSVTVRQNLVLFGELAGLRGRALADRIDEVGEALLLTQLMNRRGQTLSGGEKRRLHTAIALVGHPRLLMLDEPTSGVDVETRLALLKVVRDLANEGAAILYSTHYLGEVEQLDSSVAILDEGKFIAKGRCDELIRSYGSSVVELEFYGTPPHLPWVDAVIQVGNMLRFPSDQPTEMLASLLPQLGTYTNDLKSMEIVRPSLESVFISLTGRRYPHDAGSSVGWEAR